MVGLETMWWRQEMSGCARIDVVGVGDKQLGLKQCGGGRR